MDSGWWFRFAVILGTLGLGIYNLLPTFLCADADARLAEQLEQVDGAAALPEEAGTCPEWLPDARINLGLDLQGGIDLVLNIGVEEAVLSNVSRDIQPLLDAAEEDGIELGDVQRVRDDEGKIQPALEVMLAGETDLDDVRSVVKKRLGGYAYSTTRTDEEGNEWHLFEMSEERQIEVGKQAVEQALETLRSRVDETGVKEPSIALKGDNQINVQLPGVDNIQQAVAALGTTAVLEFFMVDEDFDESKLDRGIQAAREALDDEKFEDDDYLNFWLQDTKRIGRKNRVLWEYTEGPDGKDIRSLPYVLKDKVILTGDDVNNATVQMNQYNEPYVALEFKPRGGTIFAKVTGDNVGKRFAIVLDRKVRSAPVINEKIPGGRASITLGAGDYTQQIDEASMLSLVLRTGALPAPVTVGQARLVGASLGEDAIDAGQRGIAIGGVLVVIFMMIFYSASGLVANLALSLNIVYILALLAGFGATLTLPGIAGIALTMGMAVDANIIIYERIREELRLGKNARSAVDAGFEHALSAVVDANITTAIAGVVLYSYGTGPIKGFAVTLLVGIVTTLFTAVFVSRTFMDLYVRRSTRRLSI